jgi:hypothetical protein
MIRFVNLNVIFVVLTIAIAFGNYHVKEAAARSAKHLAEIDAAIAEEDVTLRTLDAEWSYLNEPGRLQELALRHLGLAQIEPSQVLAVAEMPERLPFEVGARHEPATSKSLNGHSAPSIEPAPTFVTPARADGFAALVPRQ